LSLFACNQTRHDPATTANAASASPTPAPAAAGASAAHGVSPTASVSAAATATASAAPVRPALTSDEFRALVTTLSEPDAEFISDNVISNETSYLQIGEQLSRAVTPGGVYLGVGPEQNFTYIALTRPSMAYVIDIRRANMLHHLLYKAMFDAARSRAEFLALLVAHPYEPNGDPGAEGTLEQVIAHAERSKPEKATFDDAHGRLLALIEKSYGFEIDARDRQALKKIHRAFSKRGLDVRFELKEASFRKYPTLRELLLQTDPQGKALGFMASEDAFRFVQRMQRENRIVPVVGDFAGDRAMPQLAERLVKEGRTVSTFYVSNVEQYLMTGGTWAKWRRNVEAFPTDGSSLFIRCYLDQGDRHPMQMAGHRTTTVLQRVADFEAHKARYKSMLALASTDVVK
jgi:hypothetical protein